MIVVLKWRGIQKQPRKSFSVPNLRSIFWFDKLNRKIRMKPKGKSVQSHPTPDEKRQNVINVVEQFHIGRMFALTVLKNEN
jgi:hypothetical protein